jgi:hypothetical protein
MRENITMSTHDHERSISTEAAFTLTNEAGEHVEVRRDLLIWENAGGEWFVAVSEPNQDDPEGDALAGNMISVPNEAAGVFDDLFTRIADPARLGARTR